MVNFNGKTVSWPSLPTMQPMHQMQPQAWQRQEVAQGAAQEVAQEARQEVVQEAGQRATQEVVQEVGQGAAQEAVQETFQEVGQGAAQRGNPFPSQRGDEGQQNARASLSSPQNPPNYPTLRDVGLRGEGYVQSQIDLPSNLRILKLLQTVPATSTQNGFNATTIAIQRQTSRGTFTFYLPYSQKMTILNALSII